MKKLFLLIIMPLLFSCNEKITELEERVEILEELLNQEANVKIINELPEATEIKKIKRKSLINYIYVGNKNKPNFLIDEDDRDIDSLNQNSL